MLTKFARIFKCKEFTNGQNIIYFIFKKYLIVDLVEVAMEWLKNSRGKIMPNDFKIMFSAKICMQF